MGVNYNKTKLACYLGFVTQAIAVNFAPLLYLKFHNDFGISFGNIALISFCLFFTQIFVDLFCAKFVDRIGYRVSIVASQVCSAAGLIGLSFLPDIIPNSFLGVIICVIVYAIGSGLIEVLGSPIIEACPFPNKAAMMSLLHSFYCWGSVGTILVANLFFILFGIDSYRWVACFFALVPIINIYEFATCPIVPIVEEGKGMGIRKLVAKPMFWLMIILMICSGASELSMSQWASAYAEASLGITKTVGDLLGPMMFAVVMGISRMIYGKYGEKLDLMKFMLCSGCLCLVCYIMASAFENPIVGLVGCIVCGFSVGIMWPGTTSISSKRFPLGGTAMFALLAMAGDLGGSIGPGIVGKITQMNNDDIRKGMMAGCVFPLVLVVSVIALYMKKGEKTNEGSDNR